MGCVDAEHGAGVEAPEDVDQLVVGGVSIDLTGRGVVGNVLLGMRSL